MPPHPGTIWGPRSSRPFTSDRERTGTAGGSSKAGPQPSRSSVHVPSLVPQPPSPLHPTYPPPAHLPPPPPPPPSAHLGTLRTPRPPPGAERRAPHAPSLFPPVPPSPSPHSPAGRGAPRWLPHGRSAAAGAAQPRALSPAPAAPPLYRDRPSCRGGPGPARSPWCCLHHPPAAAPSGEQRQRGCNPPGETPKAQFGNPPVRPVWVRDPAHLELVPSDGEGLRKQTGRVGGEAWSWLGPHGRSVMGKCIPKCAAR